MRTLQRSCLMALAVVSAVLLCAGCGADRNGDQITSPLKVSSTTTIDVSAVSTATQTSSSPTSSTTLSTTTVPESSLPGYKRPVVLLGDQNTNEEFVLGQLWALALRAQGYTVAVARNIGPTGVTNEAVAQGDLDVFPAYLNDLGSGLGSDGLPYRTLRSALAGARRYARQHGMVLLTPTPFSDTAALAVTSIYARNLGIRSLAALAAGPHPIVGVPPEYQQSATGLPLIERTYGLVPSYVMQIGLGLQYEALADNEIQAAYVNTTDPQLDSPGVQLLADPQQIYGVGNVVPVTTSKVLQAEGPAFAATLNRVDALLTLPVIRGLNAEVQLNHQDPGSAARQFLEAHGLLPAPLSAGSS